MDFIYSGWFLYYWLPVLLHLAFTWYTFDVHKSDEFIDMIKTNRQQFEKEYYPVDDIPRILKIATIWSFIPVLNILSCCVFIYYLSPLNKE